MNVFCCMYEDRHLVLGIPSTLAWSLEVNPCDGGSALTLRIDGAKDIPLLGGRPIEFSQSTLEVKDFVAACPDTIGPAERVNITHLSGDISYFEVVKQPQDMNTSTEAEMVSPKNTNRTIFYKWSKILAYLEECLGTVTVSTWYDDAMVVEFTEEAVKIEVGSDFKCELINRRCLTHIQDALSEIWNSNAKVEVTVTR